MTTNTDPIPCLDAPLADPADAVGRLALELSAIAREVHAWAHGSLWDLPKLEHVYQAGDTFRMGYNGRSYDAVITRTYRTSRERWADYEFRTCNGRKVKRGRMHQVKRYYAHPSRWTWCHA